MVIMTSPFGVCVGFCMCAPHDAVRREASQSPLVC